ncbi:CDP-glycerol glycerophosphotransferase [Actinobacteria bacterium OK074]|nr:CDP-glycerol glycerophosphotransferase [Actinobacteria bacterium OK074]
MPRFSVIVPSHGVVGRLSLALDSVLAQPFGDFELIPVCDAPGSPAGEVAAGYAARDARVAPVLSPRAAGLGAARDAGVPAATGTYLLFLDGDDELAPGALALIDARLTATADVDALHFDHARVHWWDAETTSPRLGPAPEGPFAPTAAPRPTGVGVPAWSTAYRRDFVARHQLAFPDGLFTDAGWGGRTLLAAERVAVLRAVCVRHLVRRQGSRPHAPGEGQLDLLDQVERVRLRAAELALPADRLGPLFTDLFAAVLRTAAHPERLPARLRRPFFRRARGRYRAHRPAGFRPPGGSVGVQHRLPAAGAYDAFPVLRGANRLTARATSRPSRSPRMSRTRPRYALARRPLDLRYALARRPLDANLAVYCAYWGRGYACNPAAIHAKVRELAPHVRSVFVVEPDAVASLPAGIEYEVIGSRGYWDVPARAKYLVNNADFADAVVKRPGSVHIHTPQGTPLKYMAADLLHKPGARHGFDVPGMLRRADRWDYRPVANRHSELVRDRAYPCRFTSARTGSPRNDVLVRPTPGAGAAVRERLGIPAGHTVVLYAPTRRDHVRDGLVERDGGFDLARFAADLGRSLGHGPGRGATLVVRLRPSLADGPARGYGLAELHRRGVLVDATDEPRVEEPMPASDVLVTDYSALMFDYANLDRPIVVRADDWGTFTASRGAYFDVTPDPPGHVARSYRELAWLFASGGWRDPESARLRAGFRARFGEFDDGRAAERVVRTLMLGEAELPPLPAQPAPRADLDLPASS